jgi:hypothetical protein
MGREFDATAGGTYDENLARTKTRCGYQAKLFV